MFLDVEQWYKLIKAIAAGLLVLQMACKGTQTFSFPKNLIYRNWKQMQKQFSLLHKMKVSTLEVPFRVLIFPAQKRCERLRRK